VPINDDAVNIVRNDIEDGLRDVLPGRGDDAFQVLENAERRPITNFVDGQDAEFTTVQVVPWQYTGAHVGELLGVPPQPGQPKELTVEGVSLVETNTDGEVVNLTRFVDWTKTLEDLHVRIYARPVVDVRRRFPEAFMEVPELRRLVEEGIVEPPPVPDLG
jgi:hypothetical protein